MECPNSWVLDILSKLSKNQCFQKALDQASSIYELKPYNIMALTPDKLAHLYSNLHYKFYQNSFKNPIDSWLQNQLRVFVSILIGFSYLNDKPIQTMDHQDWMKFSQAFNEKDQNILEFQSQFLIKTSTKSKKWSEEQSSLLSKIVSQRQTKNKWNQVAKTLFIISLKKFFRTPKQCREQWINHLDPSKKRSSWTSVQDFQLIQSVIKNGKRWSKVAKDLGQKRTEHMVKNRFKSLLNFEKKRIGEEDDEELLIKKMFQRLQSCQALKKLQETRKQMRELEQKREEEGQNQCLQENELILPSSGLGSFEGTNCWGIHEELELKDIEINLEDKHIFKENQCIDYFFQEPAFPHF